MELIKPSSPTPPEKGMYRLSRIDQLAPNVHVSLVFFYLHSDDAETTLCRLRTSLSEALSIYYPLAGRMKDKLFLSCDDEGAAFVEARVDFSLSILLQNPNVAEVDELLPCRHCCSGENEEGVVLSVQANLFPCGGIAIGVCASHRVADGFSLVMFLKTWAAISLGADKSPYLPTFETASIFPPQEEPDFPHNAGSGSHESFTATKIFSLDSAKISVLRAAQKLTRVEAVSALVWRCLVRAGREETLTRASVATQVVNLRRRMKPPVLDSAFGNLWSIAATRGFIPSEQKDEISRLTITQMADSTRTIAGELSPEDELSRVCKISEELVARYSECGVELCCFSSFCGFPVYEVDFGWGRPAWVARGSLHFRNSVTLMPATRKEGDEDMGMEAWVSMEPEEMSRFEKDPELVFLLSSDPCPSLDLSIHSSSAPNSPGFPVPPLSGPTLDLSAHPSSASNIPPVSSTSSPSPDPSIYPCLVSDSLLSQVSPSSLPPAPLSSDPSSLTSGSSKDHHSSVHEAHNPLPPPPPSLESSSRSSPTKSSLSISVPPSEFSLSPPCLLPALSPLPPNPSKLLLTLPTSSPESSLPSDYPALASPVKASVSMT